MTDTGAVIVSERLARVVLLTITMMSTYVPTRNMSKMAAAACHRPCSALGRT